MTATIEKRKAFIINFAFFALILGIIFLVFKYFFWSAAPFLLSFLFAVVLQRPLRWLDKKTKRKCHSLWGILLIMLSISIVLIPVIVLCVQLFKQISNFANYLTSQLSDFPKFVEMLQTELLNLLKFLPEGLYKSASEAINKAAAGILNDFDLSAIGISFDSVKGTISNGVSGLFTAVKGVPSFIIGLVIGVVAWILFTIDYDKIVKFIQLQLPENRKNLLVEIKQVFSQTILKMLRAYGIIMFITFCELAIGFTILNITGVMNNKYIYLIALATAIFDILPVAGSGGILIPWAVVAFVMGDTPQGIGVLVVYVVITIIRQYIEPKIVGDSLGVNPLITLAGLYFGLKLFGFMGMFIVPLSIMTLKAFNDTGRIQLWKTVENTNISE